jgi:hypothetical protein
MLARCGAPAVRRVLHAAGCIGGVGASLRCPSPAPPPPRAANAAVAAAVCSASARRALSLCAAAARGGSVDDIFGEADREELDLSDDRPLSRTASKKRCACVTRGGCFSFTHVRCATSPLRHHALRRVPLARTSTQRTTSAAWAASWSRCRPRRSTGCRCRPTYARRSTRHALLARAVTWHATQHARAGTLTYAACVCWRAQHLRIGGKRGTGANKKGKARVEALMAQCAPRSGPRLLRALCMQAA